MTRIQQIPLPKIRGQDTSTVNLVNQENWYQRTGEYKKWERADTCEFLWFRGRSGTGKTSETKEILRSFDEVKSELVDTVAYFCPRMSLKSETVLRSMVIQLGRRYQPRVSLLDPTQKSDLLSLIESEISTSVEVLWGLFHSLLQTSDRKVCIILDGIDALPLEDLRGFATSLHRIWSTARSESITRSTKNFWFKVLVTSRPNIELFEIFRNEMLIDPDTERSGS
jgi:Cdc6-like AAA superfamily ATPase